MKFKNILKLPFAAVADMATLGKFGDGSYIEDVLYEDRKEKQYEELEKELELAKKVVELAKILEK